MRKKRPQTAVKGGAASSLASSPVYKGIFQGSPTTGKKKKKPEPQNMATMVAKKDRLPSEHVIAYLKYLLEAAGRVKDPGDDILTIFNKITNWKQGADERGNIRDLD